MQILISPSLLSNALMSTRIVPVRALMNDPVSKQQDERDAFVIPGSVDFDLDGEGSEHSATFPHTLPPVSSLSRYLARNGITEKSPLVVYDTRGVYCSARVWWMLKALGHEHVSLLDGGLPEWRKSNLPLSESRPNRLAHYNANAQEGWFVDADFVLSVLQSQTQIIDARSRPRFSGEVPEPREGLRSGHMPGAINIPYQTLLNEGSFLSVDALSALFLKAGVDLSRPILCSCGSGITACIIGVAALMCGAKDVVVYDGSWSEWGAVARFPVSR
jgi:thiosulfate/3-mercaptopyruvate sulfurtransferase